MACALQTWGPFTAVAAPISLIKHPYARNIANLVRIDGGRCSQKKLTDMTTAGSNFIVQCPGPGVKRGDFCCSSNGNQECCSNISNGLGLQTSSSSTRATAANPSGTSTNSQSSATSTVSSSTSASLSSTQLNSTALQSPTSKACPTQTIPPLDQTLDSNSSSSDVTSGLIVPISLIVGFACLVLLVCFGLKFRKYRIRRRTIPPTAQFLELASGPARSLDGNRNRPIAEMLGSYGVQELPGDAPHTPSNSPVETADGSTGTPSISVLRPNHHPTREHYSAGAPSTAALTGVESTPSQPVSPPPAYAAATQNPQSCQESCIPGQHDGVSEVPPDAPGGGLLRQPWIIVSRSETQAERGKRTAAVDKAVRTRCND